jgi:hypothetical protein
MPSPQDEPNLERLDEAGFVPLEELLKYATLEQILYGVHMSLDGGEEISYVDTQPPADETGPPPPAPPRAESA